MSTSSGKFTSGSAIVIYLASAKFLLQLLVAGRYGIFRDELYYLACAEHLDWGYVDQPPLIAVVAWIARHLFGSSLIGLRLLPAVAGAVLVWLTGKLARELGGDRFAQGLAALAVLVSPIFLLFHHWLTMNAFEPLIWLGAALCVVRAINTGRAIYWLWFGVLMGLGMQTKYTAAFFAFGVVAGLLLTRERRFLKSKWIWIGAVVAILIFLPNLLWLIKHNFPFLELMKNIRHSGRDVARGPFAFIADQAMIMNPVLFPLWAGGLFWLFVGKREGKGQEVKGNRASAQAPASEPGPRYRILGWAYVVMLVTFIVLKGKNYYLAPVYPILFAAGGVGFERLTRPKESNVESPTSRVNNKSGLFPLHRSPFPRILIAVYVTLIVLSGVALAPLSIPILSPEQYVRYQRALGIEPPKAENQNTGPLPQHFADEFGWEDMAREVARVYNSLPPEERARTAIFANSYGQAGAIDFFGAKYGLPKAISNHQNYWYWGPRDYDGSIVIVLGSDGRGDRKHFASVEEAGHTFHTYSRRDEHFPILLWDPLESTCRHASLSIL